ncbi:MAG TPA: hypothetical protein VE754_00775 [Actinomycetota bacterium]|jgi:hypothetical protein|nr:hypothetical protein [Actinomycetota bacterium]
MSKKRDRRRRPQPPGRLERRAEADAPEPPRRRGLFGGQAGESPYPPIGVSLARGFRAVGGSPILLAVPFVLLAALWGIFAGFDTDIPPQGLVLLTGLPPVSVRLDIFVVTGITESAVWTTVFVLALATIRAAVLGAVALAIVARLRDESPRDALRRLPRVTGVLFLVLSLEFAMVVAIPLLLQTLAGPALAELGFIAALVLGLHYLGMALVIPAAETDAAANVLRRSFRAARLPGPRHLLLVVAYFSFVFWSASIAPGGALAPATPSVAVWAFALLASFIHFGVLGALAYRWLAVRDQVPRPERTEPRRART